MALRPGNKSHNIFPSPPNLGLILHKYVTLQGIRFSSHTSHIHALTLYSFALFLFEASALMSSEAPGGRSGLGPKTCEQRICRLTKRLCFSVHLHEWFYWSDLRHLLPLHSLIADVHAGPPATLVVTDPLGDLGSLELLEAVALRAAPLINLLRNERRRRVEALIFPIMS